MALIKSLPPRSSRQADAAVLDKAKNIQTVAPTIKGGTSLLDRIQLAVSLVNTKLSKYKDKYEVLKTEESVRDYFTAIIHNGRAAIDTETTSLDPISCTLAGVCLYTLGEKPVYIPVGHVSHITNQLYREQVSAELLTELLELCNQEGVKWIMHNGKYDVRVIWHKLQTRIVCWWDTMLAAKCLNENESAKLKDLHLKYCKTDDKESLTFDKLFDGIPFTLVPISAAYLYAAGDAVKTYELYEFQLQYLNRRTLPTVFNVFRNIEMPTIPAVAGMEDAGITLDVAFANQLSEKYHKQLDEQLQVVHEVLEMYANEIQKYKKLTPNHKLSDPINIGSPTQIAILLYDIMGVTSPDKNNPRGTGEEILSALDIPLSKALLDYRTIAKLLSTYIDKMPTIINPITGKIHCSFHQYGAATGRFSSSDPNMQNIPSHNKDIRKMFRASPGCVLVSADFSQQEPRTLAHMSQDENLIQAYKEGKDIYSWIASSIYKVPYEECKEFRPDGTKNPEGKSRRNSVKSIILGIMYGRGAKAIAEQLNVSVKEAQKIVDKFFQSFPKVENFIKSTEEFARQHGYVETAWGRKRRLPDMLLPDYEFSYESGRVSENFDPLAFDNVSQDAYEVPVETQQYFIKKLKNCYSFKTRNSIMQEAKQQGIKIKDNTAKISDATRQCVNSRIQGSAADMTKIAMAAIHNDPVLKELGFQLLLQVHDEVIGECPIENKDEAADRLCQLMIESAASKISVPMKCDAEITEVWYGESVI